MNELKNRSVKDVSIICADGLMGIKESITVAFPKQSIRAVLYIR